MAAESTDDPESKGRSLVITSWLVLVALTLITYFVSGLLHNPIYIYGLVCIGMMFKGQKIVDCFMELKHVVPKWRYLMLSYVFIVPLILFSVLVIFE